MKKLMLVTGMVGGATITYLMLNKSVRKKTMKVINNVLDEADNMLK